MVGEAGIEPTTPGLEGRCSIQLSYSPAFFILALNHSRRVQFRLWVFTTQHR